MPSATTNTALALRSTRALTVFRTALAFALLGIAVRKAGAFLTIRVASAFVANMRVGIADVAHAARALVVRCATDAAVFV